MGVLGYWSQRGETGRRSQRRPVKRFRRLWVPEPLEDRALPGGSLLELLLGAPLVSPFFDSLWTHVGRSRSDDLPDIEARARNRTAALYELLANPHALEQTVAEVRNLVQIASTQAQAADAQKGAFPGSEGEGTGAGAGDFPELKPWWDDPGWLAELEAVLREVTRAGSLSGFDGLGGPVLEQDVPGVGGLSVAQAGPGGPDVPAGELGNPVTAGEFPGHLPVEGDPGGGGGMATLDYGGGGYGGGGYGGGGYGGNHAPVAVNDQAYCGIDAPVVLFVLGNDHDPDGDDFSVTGVSQPAHGSAAVGSGGTSVIYTPNAGYTSGNDTFQYTVTDEGGASSQATVTVTRVEVTGFTVKRQLDSGQWIKLDDAELAWSHDNLQWTAQYAPPGAPGLTLATWWKKEWSEPDLPGNWSEFAARIVQPVEKNPGMGEWAIRPVLWFLPAGQSPFSVKPATPKYRLVPEITSIQWTTHEWNPGMAAQLVVDDWEVVMYPDAPAPGYAARDMVDVVVQIAPPRAGVVITLGAYDVDDWTDDDGPIDTDPNPADTHVNNQDNLGGWQVGFTAPPPTDANGLTRSQVCVGPIRPGNNVRMAALPRSDVLQKVKPLARDERSRLFYDTNENGFFDENDGEPALYDWGAARGIQVTRTLTVWRKLHVEVDSMGAVTDNVFSNSTTNVEYHQNGTSTIYLDTLMSDHDDNQFENGRLSQPSVGQFVIKESHADRVIVCNAGQTVPGLGAFTLEDDDYLDFPQGADVPAPNCDALRSALSKAFVTVVYDLPGQDDVTFLPNISDDTSEAVVAAQRWDSVASNSASYWVAYLLGAFQYVREEDHDPDSQEATGGVVFRDKGGALIFIETFRDASRHHQQDPVVEEKNAVVHEVGHLFGCFFNPITEYDAYSGEGPIEYLEHRVLEIRTVQKPISR